MFRKLFDVDMPALLDYLMRNEEETAFLISNSQHAGIVNRSGILRCGDYFGYFIDNVLKGVIAFYNMGNCFPHYETFEAVPYFSQLMVMRRFSMLLGTAKVIRPLFDCIKHSKYIRSFEECSYYVNYDLVPYKNEDAEFTDVTEDTSNESLNFVREAYLKGFDAERTLEGTRLLLSQKDEEEEFIILKVDGRPVAQACIQAVTPNTNQIGAVYTVEDIRGKGMGKAVVCELCERIRARGKLPTLIVNKENLPAVKAYKALGFEERGDYIIVRLYT